MFRHLLREWLPTISVSVIVTAGSATVSAQGLYSGDIGPTFGPVTDTCACEFALYDATAGGTQVGPVIERELRVRGGLYETELDFGAEATGEHSRYLQVAVGCPAGTAELTTLTRKAFFTESASRSAAAPPMQHAGAPLKAALGTGFTYQGELLQSGAPVTGNGDFQFSLWDAASGGAQIGATLPANAVSVVDGKFTAQLDFGAAAFDGDARWLEIAVDYPSGAGSPTTLSPRQPLSAAPYALQTRGIFVDDDGEVGVGTTNPQAQFEVASDGSRAMRVINTSSSGGVALQASSYADTGWTAAVDAYIASPGGVGVYSFNEAETGNGYAVAAETASGSGVAIFGHATNNDQYSDGVGVSGRSDGDYSAAGVLGRATATGGSSYGVHGIAATGTGVYGKNEATDNRGSLGTPIAGVFGQAAGASDYAGYFTGGRNYFEGNVGVGVDTPVYPLHVVGRIHVDGDIEIESGHDIEFSDPSNRIDQVYNDLRLESGDDIRVDPADDLIVDGDKLVVDGGTNRVGIGTSSPVSKLDVRGDIRTAGDFLYDTNRTGYLNITAPEFHHSYGDEDESFGTLAAHGRQPYGYIVDGSGTLNVMLSTRVDLPQGAEIQAFHAYYWDGHPAEDLFLSVTLRRASFPGITYYEMARAEATSSGSSQSPVTATAPTIQNPIVDNNDYQYSVDVYISVDDATTLLRFLGVRIEYTMDRLNP